MSLYQNIQKYVPCNEQEVCDKEQMLAFLQSNPDCLDRVNKVGHFTASVWVVNPERTKTLMVYHNLYDSWSWIGGHADGEEDLCKVALRELSEETGVKHARLISSEIFSLETLTVDGHIKRGKYVPCHLHFNVTYLAEADEAETLVINKNENKGVKWWTFSDALAASTEKWMVEHVYKKLVGKFGKDKSMREVKTDKLTVKIMGSRAEMGQVAAAEIVAAIKAKLEEKEELNMIFAAAPSQNEVLKTLTESDVDWSRINAFHMDEYIGLDKSAPQGFGHFLMDHIFGKVPFKSVNLIDCEAADPEKECERYEKLLNENPVDIIVLGIGENGHIAFNDPWVADFKDAKKVKTVLLDEVCRQQQVNDGCFASIDQVPKSAITLTCPVFIHAPQLFCIVPASTKAKAVKQTVYGEINEECPATVLREHPAAVLYLDADSSSLL